MLKAHDITYGYSSTKAAPPILKDVTLSIAPRERVHLIAPSGTGKTTLCQLLAGYLQPWSGDITCDDKPLPRRGACPVQLISQHPERALDPRMRMRESLCEGGWEATDPDHATLLERIGIRKTWLSRYPHELSGGELQRFCIARVLLVKPRYLIADEITTMLDAISQAQIWQVLLSEIERQNIGLLFTTHTQALADELSTRSVDLLDMTTSNKFEE